MASGLFKCFSLKTSIDIPVEVCQLVLTIAKLYTLLNVIELLLQCISIAPLFGLLIILLPKACAGGYLLFYFNLAL